MSKSSFGEDPPARQIPAGKAEQEQWFETQLRPLLVEKCYSCHAADTEQNGGLRLDALDAMLQGGDSGPAIDSKHPAQSLLWKAIEYRDPELQMPPDGKLNDSQLRAIQSWLEAGAPVPENFRSSAPSKTTSQALPVERAREHWAYQPIRQVRVPSATNTDAPEKMHPIDAFLSAGRGQAAPPPSPTVSDRVFLKRLTIDLHGLNATYEQLAEASTVAELDATDRNAASRRERWVDAMLASPRFGERFARHWMDVVRYAESLTLRGFIMPDVWRYRNYLIDCFNRDHPFNQMAAEQIAGDLMPSGDPTIDAARWSATTMLAIGDHNYEEQDKPQLEMDAIDEQLDTLGKAFLAQTLNCARCHDHKFDPIPTADYYALAGILKSSVAMDHENVSKWVRMPLPLPDSERSHYEQIANEHASNKRRIDAIKKQLGASPKQGLVFSSDVFAGTVIDDRSARKVGDWQPSSSIATYIDQGYLHDKNAQRGEKSATFEPQGLSPGNYRVRMAYAHGENRSTKTSVRISSADGDQTILVNQRIAPSDDGLWQTLGTARVERDGQAFVIVSNEGADGHVIVDAIQFLPEGMAPRRDAQTEKVAADAETPSSNDLQLEAAALEKKNQALQRQLDARPMVQTVRAASQPGDVPIHIRGSVHRLGQVVPRGFLSCIDAHDPQLAERYRIAPHANGRLELAQWLIDPANPLTSRVYVNRVWAWLMGQGLVRTLDNFGTTGEPPQHLELLDWLTSEFITNGWSTKWLVKTIVTSDAYRRSVHASPEVLASDPENRDFTRSLLRRLDAESLRDSMLMASGELEFNGDVQSTIRADAKSDYRYVHEVRWRSIYMPWFRNALPELIRELDGANPSFSISARNRSTVPPQALTWMNSPWIRDRATRIANRIEEPAASKNPSDAAAPQRAAIESLHNAFRAVLGRDPESAELEWAVRTVEQSSLTELVHQLLASIDFRYCE